MTIEEYKEGINYLADQITEHVDNNILETIKKWWKKDEMD